VARDGLRRLADDRAAIRRVWEASWSGENPWSTYELVCREAGALLGASSVSLFRFTSDGLLSMRRGWSSAGEDVLLPFRGSVPIEPGSIGYDLRESGTAVFIDVRRPTDLSEHVGLVAGTPFGWAMAAPIYVTLWRRMWGALIATGRESEPMVPEAFERLTRFAELVDPVVSAGAARLTRSIVSAADHARQRIKHTLEMTAESRLLRLRDELAAIAELLPVGDDAHDAVRQLETEVDSVVEDVRELANGLHPGTLVRGLAPALSAVVERCPVPVDLRIRGERRNHERVEIGAYYVVSEALTNATKHAQASRITVEVALAQASIRVSVEDDGRGGAVIVPGSGLSGLVERVEALGGSLALDSPAGGGTRLTVELPDAAPPFGTTGEYS
jgi:signal transduction histidine kinase